MLFYKMQICDTIVFQEFFRIAFSSNRIIRHYKAML